jgi:hypothetical protein
MHILKFYILKLFKEEYYSSANKVKVNKDLTSRHGVFITANMSSEVLKSSSEYILIKINECNPEILATLYTQDTGRRQTQHRNLKDIVIYIYM